MRRRTKQARVKTPQLHAFRRWFALSFLRAGMNVYSLQELMGHADLQVLRRYLKQTNQDIRVNWDSLFFLFNRGMKRQVFKPCTQSQPIFDIL
jgi:site-specific recombinase XerD